MIPDRRLFDSWRSVLVSPDTKVLNTINAFFLHVLYSTELLIRISRIRLTKVLLYDLKGEVCIKRRQKNLIIQKCSPTVNTKAGKSLSDYLKLE